MIDTVLLKLAIVNGFVSSHGKLSLIPMCHRLQCFNIEIYFNTNNNSNFGVWALECVPHMLH